MSVDLKKVSVIFPLYNPDINFLIETIRLLIKNEDKLIEEIILVDDGSTRPIKDSSNLFQRISSKILIVRQKNKGAGAARNTGARLSKSNILIFTDWDCRPYKNWLENLTKPILEKNAVAVCGKILARKENDIFSEFSDFMRALREPVRNQKGEIIIIITANAAFSKKVFNSVGGFDSRFSASGGEDLDLTYKLSEAGYSNRFFHEPNAILEHMHRSNLTNFLKQQFNYGFWDMYHFILRKRDPKVLQMSFPTLRNVFVYIKDIYSFRYYFLYVN
jgi:cellulose synthase/poly-beta-1,6-N-acetylglucosamine synthase-like glycosyltransferase